ncbi:PaaI family thioesterase [Candidatus Poriferisocius sp.]|uniref:PaaI family thioesterase n=1 Tax=Candidatus Poriferisocius sp. TaxID=3101276 RepID=UPI003B58C64E
MAHINQPGGPFQAIEHPAVSGRERELRSLADGVRRLVAATVAHVATPAETAALAAEVQGLADRLEGLVPAEPLPRFGTVDPQFDGPPVTHKRAPFDLVTGICNPAALPVEMVVDTEADPPVSRGRAVFSTVYEGPPGCVHGAAIAGAFDMVFTSACSVAGASGPTMMLSVRYVAPTLLQTETVFEGWVEKVGPKTTRVKGCARQGGHVTAEAEGVFRRLDLEAMRKLSQQAAERRGV